MSEFWTTVKRKSYKMISALQLPQSEHIHFVISSSNQPMQSTDPWHRKNISHINPMESGEGDGGGEKEDDREKRVRRTRILVRG